MIFCPQEVAIADMISCQIDSLLNNRPGYIHVHYTNNCLEMTFSLLKKSKSVKNLTTHLLTASPYLSSEYCWPLSRDTG